MHNITDATRIHHLAEQGARSRAGTFSSGTIRVTNSSPTPGRELSAIIPGDVLH